MPDIRQTTVPLDDFERAAEDPLSFGGKWSQTAPGLWNAMVTTGSTATHMSARTISDSHWNVQTYDGNEAEAWGTPLDGGASGIAWAIDLWSVVGTSQPSGYRFRSDVASGGSAFYLYKFVAGVRSTIASSGPGFTVGNSLVRMLIRRNGNDVEGWYSTDAAATWTLKVSATDTDYTTGLYIGIGITDNSAGQILSWGDFGGGASVNRPQIYRWIKN